MIKIVVVNFFNISRIGSGSGIEGKPGQRRTRRTRRTRFKGRFRPNKVPLDHVENKDLVAKKDNVVMLAQFAL